MMKKILLFATLFACNTMIKLMAEPNDGGLKRFQISIDSKTPSFFSALKS